MSQIYNIFGESKKEKVEEKEEIIIDYREKQSLVPAELIRLNHKVTFQELKVGDYVAGKTIIERKALGDFIASIKDQRLDSQIKSLQECEEVLIIVEKEALKETKMHENAIRGMMLKIATREKIPLIISEGSHDTAQYISLLARKKDRVDLTRVRKRAETIEEQLEFIIEGFPGIGKKNAQKLLKEFQTLEKIFLAKDEEIESCIGKKGISVINLRKRKYN